MYSIVDFPVFAHPFTGIVSGSTKSGKTEWTKKLIQHANALIHPNVEEVLWCYGEWQDSYRDLAANPHVRLIEGLPDLEELKGGCHTRRLLVLDDLMHEACKTDSVSQLFTKGSHHWNLSCLFLVQSLFFSPALRTIRLNSHIICLMRNPADKSQVLNLARQLYPGNNKHLLEAYKEATEQKYGYLLVDLSPEVDERLRLRTRVFPGETHTVFVSKNI